MIKVYYVTSNDITEAWPQLRDQLYADMIADAEHVAHDAMRGVTKTEKAAQQRMFNLMRLEADWLLGKDVRVQVKAQEGSSGA